MIHSAIVDVAIDPARLMDLATDDTRGGAVLFAGRVRDHNEGRAVIGLDYRAYRPMAERELALIVAEAAAQWESIAIAVEHRIGALVIGDLAVVVVAAHAHRRAAFAACEYVVEQLKQRVPIWKREHYADGPSAWVEVHA
jgi:molybdopterin synthase catalytic subunit